MMNQFLPRAPLYREHWGLCYLATPMAKLAPGEGAYIADTMLAELLDADFLVFSPIAHNARAHQFRACHKVSNFELYKKLDFKMLEVCDTLLFADIGRASYMSWGMYCEIHHALKINKRILRWLVHNGEVEVFSFANVDPWAARGISFAET